MTFAFMRTLVPVGRCFFGIGLVAFGVLHFVYGDFVTRVVLSWPAWMPGRLSWVYAMGAALIAVGAEVIVSKTAHTRSTLLIAGALFLLSFLALSLPVAAADVAWGGLWTSAMKTLVLSGGAWLVASTLPAPPRASGPSSGGGAGALAPLERLIPLGRYFFAAFLLLAGIQHFIWSAFVVTLVPAWIPGGLFWTYFAGVALIAAALGLVIPRTMRLAAALTALMIFSWVLLVHLPRAIAFGRASNGNETTAFFEALAFTGVAIILAGVGAGADAD